MELFQIIQEYAQEIKLENSDINYYPMMFLFIFGTILLAFFLRMIAGFVVRKIIPVEYEKLSNKVVRRVQSLVAGTVIFLGLMAILMVFFYADTALWKNLFRIFVTIFLIYATFAIMSIDKAIFIMLSRRENPRLITKQTLPLFNNIANIFIILVVAYVIFAVVWNVNMNALFASMGIVGVAISFAARDTIANFFSGMFIMADQPYKIGDFVDLDSGERGEVVDIGIRSTRILTMDDVEIVIPNSIMGNTPVINESGGTSRTTRIAVDVSVAYGTDVQMIKNILVAIARNCEHVVEDPAPVARFSKFGESGLHLQLLCWIEEAKYRGKTIDEINMYIYDEFNRRGIEIPYRKQDIYIRQIDKKL
jgi:small-conductance mechanosensitive channel